MKVLIAGAGGQLGVDAAGLFSEEGATVSSFDSRSLDVTDRVRVLDTVSTLRPDVVINCSAYTKVDLAEKERERAFSVNSAGAGNIAEAAARVKAPVIHVSTDFVFDGRKGTPYTEEDETNPLCVYGESKLSGETEVMKANPRHAIVRTSWLYGAHGGNFVKTMLRLGAEREVLRVVYDQVGSPTWTYDLAGALLMVAKKLREGSAPYGVYNYSNEGVASWYDLAFSVMEEARSLGVPLACRTVEPILTAEYPTPAARPRYSVLDKKKIKEAFGLTIPHWRVSLRGMLKELFRKESQG